MNEVRETTDEYIARRVEEYKEQYRRERLEKLRQQKQQAEEGGG